MSTDENTDPMPPGLTALCSLDSPELRRAYLTQHPGLLTQGAVEGLTGIARKLLRIDVEDSLRKAEAALGIAELLGSKESLAHALRAKGNSLWFKGECRPAVELMEEASRLFEELGKADELGRTLSSSIQPLILLGEYHKAICNADRARQIFADRADARRLARLDVNVANIYHRQERYADALAAYERGYEQLMRQDDAEGIGVALHNMAVCLIALNQFGRALEIYQKARAFFLRQGMPVLLAQADYNIACMHFLRGEFELALKGLRAAREMASAAGDAYHAALCELDLSDIYLELNLVDEAAAAAQEAVVRFERLGMGYEAARSLTNLGIAASRRQDRRGAMKSLARARTLFAEEGHPAGESLADLYQAILRFDRGDLKSSRRLCLRAGRFFRASGLVRREVVCDLLLSRIALEGGDLVKAQTLSETAILRLEGLGAPVLSCQAHFQSGLVHQAAGRYQRSYEAYQVARQGLETLRSSLQGEELRMAFMKNRLEVYERLVQLSLRRGSSGAPAEEALGYIEQAKSRSLVDAIFGRTRPLARPIDVPDGAGAEIVRLRGELNSFYHQIEVEQLRQEGTSAERLEGLWARARTLEDELLRAVRESPVATRGEPSTADDAIVTLAGIRDALADDAALVEYFQTDDEILAVVVAGEIIEVVPLTAVRRVKDILRMLQFQLSKFRLGPAYTERLEETLLASTLLHLQALYRELAAPLRQLLKVSHLVIVPHGILHHVPIHALHDGSGYLIDQFSISYAPSASLFVLCRSKGASSFSQSLILGVEDPKAPWILAEARAVAAVVRNHRLLIGEDASGEALRTWGPSSRRIHIATHGYFRRDNPMFSAVRLSDGYLSVYDLYNLWLPVDLLTLSGCATGLSVVAAGDELIGLARGLLFAGARALVLALWDVQDRSAAEFMRSFYLHLESGRMSQALAVRAAALELRRRHPHPYHWAPFILVGTGGS